MIDPLVDPVLSHRIVILQDLIDLLANYLREAGVIVDEKSAKEHIHTFLEGPFPEMLLAMSISADLPRDGRELCINILRVLKGLGITPHGA